MYRFLLTPRWWAINVFAVLAIPFCLFMGSWQLGRFETRVDSHREQQDQADEARSAAATPLGELLPVTTETSGRKATATGRYDAGHQLLVPDRDLDERKGFYVLTPLRTDEGKALPVVRGWVPGDVGSKADTAKIPAPPTGRVTVSGALQSSESATSKGVHTSGGLPTGQLGVISAASLVNVLPYGVYDAWITATDAPAPLTPVPPAAPPNSGLDLKAFQNLGYTGEWFVFVGFVLFMWFRLFRREAEAARDAALGLAPEPGLAAAPGGTSESGITPERGSGAPGARPGDPDAAPQKRSPAGAA
ncbi:SURF1 family protein [Streptomyces sp. I05A-00742]|uniref:SURF1 family protein n=1 Tax=Streptomyces sp. I05A-00742 TaxID=2732853 RepID=UPI0014881BF3|nr:SURF1 family protein [Streptomyces sp. I05A-00742]